MRKTPSPELCSLSQCEVVPHNRVFLAIDGSVCRYGVVGNQVLLTLKNTQLQKSCCCQSRCSGVSLDERENYAEDIIEKIYKKSESPLHTAEVACCKTGLVQHGLDDLKLSSVLAGCRKPVTVGQAEFVLTERQPVASAHQGAVYDMEDNSLDDDGYGKQMSKIQEGAAQFYYLKIGKTVDTGSSQTVNTAFTSCPHLGKVAETQPRSHKQVITFTDNCMCQTKKSVMFPYRLSRQRSCQINQKAAIWKKLLRDVLHVRYKKKWLGLLCRRDNSSLMSSSRDQRQAKQVERLNHFLSRDHRGRRRLARLRTCSVAFRDIRNKHQSRYTDAVRRSVSCFRRHSFPVPSTNYSFNLPSCYCRSRNNTSALQIGSVITRIRCLPTPIKSPSKLIAHGQVQSELSALYFLNINSNAGISESGTDGAKADTKQPSCTSVHSSDQYYSTHTDTPDGKVVDSDMEVSPSFSFTEDGGDRVAGKALGDNGPTVSRSFDYVKNYSEDQDSKSKLPVSVEMKKQKRHKRNSEDASLEETTDTKVEKHTGKQAGAVEEHAPNKHNRKTKTTETLYIKFESSLSKKVTTTTVVKDGRRPGINKQRHDIQKQSIAADDGQRSISGQPEKSSAETPRHTKIVRCSDGFHERIDSPVKYFNEIILDPAPLPLPTPMEESSQAIIIQHDVRAAESGQPSFPAKLLATSCEIPAPAEQSAAISDRLTSQKSPTKSHSRQNLFASKQDTLDSDHAFEKESSVATIVNVQNSSPNKDVGSLLESSEKVNQVANKPDKTKRGDSPKRELKNIPEKKEPARTLTPGRKELPSAKPVRKEDLRSRSVSPKSERSVPTESVTRRKSTSRPKGESPIKKSPLEQEGKKPTFTKGRNKTDDEVVASVEVSETAKAKTLPLTTAGKKKISVRAKTQSRSPDFKKRKRSAKKSAESKSVGSMECQKSDKIKKHKLGEKGSDKKKKKKKPKKATGKTDDSSDSQQSKKGPSTGRSRSSEFHKTTQTPLSSASLPHFLEASVLCDQPSPISYFRKDEGRSSPLGERHHDGDNGLDGTQRSHIIRNRGASSAENVSITTTSNKPIRAAESVPTFTGTVYTSITKVVQLASCPRTKKSEKDLQQAELGWNSSTVSAEERAAAEKAKLNQKRAKARYYLVKPKLKRCDNETGKSKNSGKRNPAEQDNSTRETSDASLQEKSRTNAQGKCVQFSQSTEDHEASKDETTSDKTSCQEISVIENTEMQSANRLTIEVMKLLTKPDTDVPLGTCKPAQNKKDELRTQTTPPRKRCPPIWLKKPVKERPATVVKTTTTAKSVPTLAHLKQRQSSENMIKPPSRSNVQLYCSGRRKTASPSLSNASLDDTRTVSYNTWINSSILGTPMNKATRKLVAKAGSPVDIREIIEGSSVDGAEYYRTIRSLHELGVRAAKSVPTLGGNRMSGIDVFGGKRFRPRDEIRGALMKRNKDIRVQESGSTRSLSSSEGTDDVSYKNRAGLESSVSPASSTDVDNAVGPRYKSLYRPRKKDKKLKRPNKDNNWRLGQAQDVRSVPDLTRVQYYGDVAELNALSMGLSWMVQSVFNRLPFLNQTAATPNAFGDMPSSQQTGE